MRRLIWFALPFAVTACLDVEQIEPDTRAPLLWPAVRKIDDFDDPRGQTTWTLFAGWGCNTWPDPDTIECGLSEPGFEGVGQARFIDFDLTAHGPDDYPGAQMSADRWARLPDFQGYDQFFLRAKVEPTDPARLPEDFELAVALGCFPVGGLDNPEEPTSVDVSLLPVADGAWHSYALDIDAFTQPAWQTFASIDARECLANVDQIAIKINKLGSSWQGRTMAGRLEIDDVQLRKFIADPALGSSVPTTPWSCTSFLANDDPDAGRDDPGACGTSDQQATLSFAVDYLSAAEHWSSMCVRVNELEDVSRELLPSVLDLSAFESLTFAASFSPAEPAQESARFVVELHCDGLFPSSGVSGVYSFEALPGTSSYKLPLASFQPSLYPNGFTDVPGCLTKVDSLCFSTKLEPGEASAGTLSVGGLAFQ